MPSSRRGRSRSPRRRPGRYIWNTDGIDPVSINQDVQASTQLLPGIDPAVAAGSTIVRIIGTWFSRVLSSDFQGVMHFGIVMMNEDQRLAGAFPEAQVDDVSWLFRDIAYGFLGDVTANPGQSLVRQVDTRARRRIRSQEDQAVVLLENISPQATQIQVAWNLRTLIYVP